MIDTHAHIYLEQFDKDRTEVLDRAAQVGVKRILMPAINEDSFEQMRKMRHGQIHFHSMAGMHPCEVNVHTNPEQWIDILEKQVETGEYLAIGEIGLDYYWDKTHVDKQKHLFRMQVEVARARNKPIVIHNRDSTADMLDIIEELQDGSLRGVWHCFNGSVSEGKRAISLGMYLGIGGVLTFKNAGVDKTVSELPIERMILETDSPYLAPVPYRGKRNEPAYILEVAKKLAVVKNCDLVEIQTLTSENAKALFDLE